MYKDNVLDPNSQKTHYSLRFPDRKQTKRHKPSQPPTHILKTLSQESRQNVDHRFQLYETVWGHQKNATEHILNSANMQLFGDLLRFIKAPVSEKLDSAFLGLGSNTANNLRILDEFTGFVSEDSSASYIRIVRLNSKVCINIKNTIKEVVKQIVEEQTPAHVTRKDEFEAFGQESDDETAPANEDDSDYEDVEAEEDQQPGEVDGGRIAYDFEIVQEWVDSFEKRTRDRGRLRIVVILDDSDGFSNETLNQIIQLFAVYRLKCPVKMVMGLSTRNVSDWICSNITSKLRTLIHGVKLEATENKNIGFQVIDAILLQNEITSQNPLLLDAQLSSIILSRFENSNNSIDSLISELKLAYMIYFYQSPLASLLDPDFQPQPFHYEGLRMLPSFKTHIESLVHKFELQGNSDSTDGAANNKDADSIRQEIMDLLKNDLSVYELFSKARARFDRYQNSVMNAVNVVHWLCKGSKEKFQIYKLVTNNQLVNSAVLSDLLKKVKMFSAEDIAQFREFVLSDTIKKHIKNQADEDVIEFVKRVQSHNGDLVEIITHYLHSNRNVNMKISDNLFNEVLTINGGISELDELKPKVSIEENYENLMINLIRPNTREILESGMNEPQKYLRNPVLLGRIESPTADFKSSRLAGPSLCKLYQIYKDAPVNINLWDFFTAFQQSLSKREITKEIVQWESEDLKQKVLGSDGEISDERWDRMIYAWFIQGCYELTSMGFLKEKTKGDYVEKLVWKCL